jgi:hypothetical protein
LKRPLLITGVIGSLVIITLFIIAIIYLPSSPKSVYQEFFNPDKNDCPSLCWHGIEVGKTTLDEAFRLLQKDNTFTAINLKDWVLTWETVEEPKFKIMALSLSTPSEEARISFLRIEPDFMANFTVQDAISIWGEPTGLQVRVCNAPDSYHGEANIFFNHGVRITSLDLGLFGYKWATDTPEIRLEPGNKIVQIRFFSSSDTLVGTENMLPWYGFRSWLRDDDEVGYSSMCNF